MGSAVSNVGVLYFRHVQKALRLYKVESWQRQAMMKLFVQLMQVWLL